MRQAVSVLSNPSITKNKDLKPSALLAQMGVYHLYHLTSLANMAAIKRDGLLSRRALLAKNKSVVYLSNNLSHSLDAKYGLDNCVHLALYQASANLAKFRSCANQPVVLLEFSTALMDVNECLISMGNATSNAGYIDCAKRILLRADFVDNHRKAKQWAVDRFNAGDDARHAAQSEVLVERHLALEFLTDYRL
jgi:hypothetical protein